MATAGADGTGGSRTPAPAIALLAVVVALAAAPAAAHAADEPSTQMLPGDAHSAVVVDLDGDGVTELVRIVAEDPSRPIAEAWGFRGDAWELIGTASIPRLDDPGVGDGSAVVAWRAKGRARALVLVSCCSAPPEAELPTCCLAAYELVRTPDGVMLEPRLENARPADTVHVIDVDGDGTDELVRSANSYTGETGEIEVLRRDGDAFTSEFLADVEGGVYGLLAGDSDGVEGHDIVLGPMPDGNLRRIAWVDGGIGTEEAHLDLGERFDGYPMAVAHGAILLSMADELQVITWPRGERPVRAARLAGLVYPYGAIVEAGSRTLLAIQAAGLELGQPTANLRIFDLDLRELGQVEASPIAARVERLLGFNSGTRSWERHLFPYGGPLGAAASGPSPGFVWNGMLIEADADEGYRAQPIAPLLGLQAIGFAGPDDEWVVLSSAYLNIGNAAYLYPGFITPGRGRISLARVEDVLRPDVEAATIELRDAVEVGRTAGDVTQLIADGEGFDVVVNAPEGSWVVARNRQSFSELTVESEPLVVEVSPRSGRDEDENAEDKPIDASLVVATPDGQATVVEWSGTFVGGPPELSVSGRTDSLSFGATLEGTAGSHATVRVDGVPVAVGAGGRFTVAVGAGLWPSTVLVSAMDPLGNEVVERVEVVGVFDYRGLPWAAIVAVATVSVGGVLFVRIPRRRAPIVADEAGDGLLEELDPIDGTSFGER